MLVIETQPLPLYIDSSGVARVGGTRVTLETVVSAFLEGDSAEEIVEQYPVLSLAEVYAVIAYYLNHQDQIDGYLAEQRARSQQTRQIAELRNNPYGIRQRLMKRIIRSYAGCSAEIPNWISCVFRILWDYPEPMIQRFWSGLRQKAAF
jgi:uncharacterized protein (DUF433 family)